MSVERMLEFPYTIPSFLLCLVGVHELGRKITGKSSASEPALAFSAGWTIWMLLLLLLGMTSKLSMQSVYSSQLVFLPLGLTGLPRILKNTHAFFAQTFAKFSILEKGLLVFCLMLFIVRLFRAILPHLGWDALGYHYSLVEARLNAGDLAPLYDIPVDRRVPLTGVLFRAIPFSMDEYGRVISLFHLFLMLLCSFQVARIVRERMNLFAALFAAIAFFSLTDWAVYATGPGDETIMSLFFIASVSVVLKPDCSLWELAIAWLLAGLCLSIKITAVFWTPALVVLLCMKSKKSLQWLPLFVLLFLLPPILAHGKTWLDYGGVYPLERNFNFFYKGGDANKTFQPDSRQVLDDKALLGDSFGMTDRQVRDEAFLHVPSNLLVLFTLPLGPFFCWGLIVLLFERKKTMPLPKGWRGVTLFLAVTLLLALIAWPFTPPALFRYLMPVWPLVAILSAFLVFGEASRDKRNWIFSLCLLMLFYAFGLEAKAVKNLMSSNLLNPKEYWMEKSADASLLRRFEDLRSPSERAFYVGPCSYLLPPGDLSAMAGNETGYRMNRDFPAWLKEKKIDWWVYSSKVDRLGKFHRKRCEYLQRQGWLKPVYTGGDGLIFRVSTP